jgi:hypothetical protein
MRSSEKERVVKMSMDTKWKTNVLHRVNSEEEVINITKTKAYI